MRGAVAFTVQLATIAAVVTRCEPSPHVEHITTRDTVVVALPTPMVSTTVITVPQLQVMPMTPASPVRPACPPPRTDAPAITPGDIPDSEWIEHVEPSVTNAGWIAAWNTNHVFVSTDAGASWERVLDGPGDVRAVGFDCFGRAIVVRTSGVGVRDATTEAWRPVPGVQIADQEFPQDDGTVYTDPADVAVIGGGPDIVIAGHSDRGIHEYVGTAAVSSDLGATWGYFEVAKYFEGGTVRGRQHANGMFEVGMLEVDCMSEDLAWTRVRDGKVDRSVDWNNGMSFVLYDDSVVIAGASWRKRATDDWKAITGLPPTAQVEPVPGPRPMVVAGSQAFRVTRGTARALPWLVEGSGHGADPAGRIWSVVCGAPWIAKRTASGRTCE